MSQINQVMLIMFDTKQNCNKFYEVILDASGDVIARYGRVGQTGMKKVYSGGTGKFNSLINSKKKKGYREAEVEGLSSQDNTPSVSKNNAIEVALKQISYKDRESLELIKRVANANIHNIVGNSSVTYDKEDGLFKTPLGIIRKNAVLKAMSILDDIKALVDKPNISASEESRLFDLNTEYFFLIPNKVKNAREKRFLVFDEKNWETQRSVCESLLDTLDLISDLKKGKKELKEEAEKNDIPKVFDVSIEKLDDDKMLKKIVDMYESSKNSMHGHRPRNSKIVNVYKIALGSQQKPFEKASKEIGNVHLLWHGTRVANTLSIMSKGLLMPKVSPGQKAGAMFGDGLYFANQSTKSLQYCDGMFWASGSQSKDTIYMF
jgi:predicted DNA-binding WGR domain protein